MLASCLASVLLAESHFTVALLPRMNKRSAGVAVLGENREYKTFSNYPHQQNSTSHLNSVLFRAGTFHFHVISVGKVAAKEMCKYLAW